MIAAVSRKLAADRCRRRIAPAAIAWLSSTLFAQAPTDGGIRGRVFDSGCGEYLDHAQVSIEGTSLVTFTASAGGYRFDHVPAEIVRMKVFFTGLDTEAETVAVFAGREIQLNIRLAPPKKMPAAREDADFKLEKVLITGSQLMDGAAVAIQTQRFASSMINVVAADEFGTIVDGTPGEALKFLRGVTMTCDAGEARNVSINGVPSGYACECRTISPNLQVTVPLDDAFPMPDIFLRAQFKDAPRTLCVCTSFGCW